MQSGNLKNSKSSVHGKTRKKTKFNTGEILKTQSLRYSGKCKNLKSLYNEKGHDLNPWFSGITFFLD